MNVLKIAARIVLAWIALLAAQMAAGMLIHVDSPPMPDIMRWLMLSNLVVVLALGSAALRSDWRDWRLARAMFVIPVVIAAANMIEGILFLPNLPIDWRGIMALTLVSYGIAAVLWLFIFRGATVAEAQIPSGFPHHSFGQTIGRFALCSACYVFLYYLAGTIIFPYVRDFYATQRIPSPGEIVSLQFLIRGPLFVLLCLLLLRMFRLPRPAGAFAVGLAFTLLSGVATLIIPNPFFPDSVRWVHLCEVTSSNFVFGAIVGWVWGQVQHAGVLKAAHA